MTRMIKHCALYTRKSTEEGLDQAFNTAASPGFVDASAGDYRPLPGSELTTAPDVGVRTDLFGAPRAASPGVTYGAAETAPSEPSDG